MKLRILLTLALLSLFVLSSRAQWSVGLRDTRYVNVNYSFGGHWNAKFEQSVYSEKIGHQYFRFYFSYSHSFGPLSVSAQPYYGMTYKNDFRSMGLNADARLSALKWLGITAGFSPHYDSGLGYKSLYSASLEFNCTSQISITAGATNRPEFRQPENRIRVGVRFRVENLSVHPEISIPASRSEGRSVRVLASMEYTFCCK